MQTNNEFTQVQAETLAFIKTHIDQHGYSPTFAEIAKAAKVNVNAVGDRIAQMIKKGAITKAPGIARSIRPTQERRRSVSAVVLGK